jgi:hypothetical protein
MNTIIHIAMLLLSYIALYAFFRAGKAHLKYKSEHEGQALVSYDDSTQTWTSMISWFGVGIVCLVVLFKIATP